MTCSIAFSTVVNADAGGDVLDLDDVRHWNLVSVETCLDAVEKGVDAAVILDGRMPHVMLLEIFTDRGIGTLIRRNLAPGRSTT